MFSSSFRRNYRNTLKLRAAVQRAIEPLERRTLLAGTPSVFYGTEGWDSIGIETNYGSNNSIRVSINGTDTIIPHNDAGVIIYGLGGDDSMIFANGTSNNHTPVTLDGGEGNDSFRIFKGDASIVGGNGNDEVRMQLNSSLLGFDAGAASDTLDAKLWINGPSEIDMNRYPALEVFRGAYASVKVTGNSLSNLFDVSAGPGATVLGMGGDDTINGSAYADSLIGGDGHDRIFGMGGNDWIEGNAGYDFLAGDAGNDVLLGGTEDDNLFGGVGDDAMQGGDGNDLLYGQENNDSIEGNNGNDYIDAGDGEDSIWGNAGSDSLYGNTGHDEVHADDGAADAVVDGVIGTDLAYYDSRLDNPLNFQGLAPTSGPAMFYGTVGIDRLLVDTDIGVSDSDILVSINGISHVIPYRAAGVIAYGLDGNDQLDSANFTRTRTPVTLDGGNGNDAFWISDADAYVIGAAGDDNLFIEANSGLQGYDAGTGTDLLSSWFWSNDARGYVDMNEYPGLENYAADLGITKIVGNSLNNRISTRAGGTLMGMGGNDTLIGYAGSDTLEGGDGDDLMDGGFGSDYFYGGPGSDTADYSSRSSSVTVSIGEPFGQDGDGEANEQDRVTGDMENIYGGSGNDLLIGDSRTNILQGNGGNDTINGGDATDVLFGGDGNDLVRGDGGDDWLEGNNGNDTLEGALGNDTLIGHDGIDTYDGAAGQDQLWVTSVGHVIPSGGQDQLDVSPGARAIVAAGLNATLALDTLSMHGGSVLDLNDNDLTVARGNHDQLWSLVLQGYRDSADSTATGIISSTAQTAIGHPILALFDNALLHATDWPWGSGHTVGATAIVGKYAYLGDADLNGMVTPDDYSAVDSNLGRSVSMAGGMNWFAGDWNLDGQISPDDYGAIDANLGLGEGQPLAAPDALKSRRAIDQTELQQDPLLS